MPNKEESWKCCGCNVTVMILYDTSCWNCAHLKCDSCGNITPPPSPVYLEPINTGMSDRRKSYFEAYQPTHFGKPEGPQSSSETLKVGGETMADKQTSTSTIESKIGSVTRDYNMAESDPFDHFTGYSSSSDKEIFSSDEDNPTYSHISTGPCFQKRSDSHFWVAARLEFKRYGFYEHR